MKTERKLLSKVISWLSHLPSVNSSSSLNKFILAEVCLEQSCCIQLRGYQILKMLWEKVITVLFKASMHQNRPEGLLNPLAEHHLPDSIVWSFAFITAPETARLRIGHLKQWLPIVGCKSESPEEVWAVVFFQASSGDSDLQPMIDNQEESAELHLHLKVIN